MSDKTIIVVVFTLWFAALLILVASQLWHGYVLEPLVAIVYARCIAYEQIKDQWRKAGKA